MGISTLKSQTFAATIIVTAIFHLQIAQAEDAWTLAKESDDIRVYTRTVANSPLKEFKGETEIAATPEQIVRALRDANSFSKWMPDVVVSELLSSTDADQYHYLENAAPWPVSNRDGVYHFVYSRSADADGAVVTVRVEAAPDYRSRLDGKVRITKSDGFWRIAQSDGRVVVTYQIHADPGGSIPSWLANSTVVDTPYKTLKSLRTYVQTH